MEHHKSDLQTKRDRSEGPEGANKKQHMVACETDQDIGSKAAGEADQAPSEQHAPLDAAPHLAQHSQVLEASDAQVDDKKLVNAGSSIEGFEPVHARDAHLKPAAGGTAAPLSDVDAAGPSTPAGTLSPVGTPQGLIQALEALHQTLNLDLQKVVTGHQVVYAKMMGNMGVVSKLLMKVLTHMDAQRPGAAQAAMSIKECHEAMLGGLEAAHCCSASLFDSANRLQTVMALTKHSLLHIAAYDKAVDEKAAQVAKSAEVVQRANDVVAADLVTARDAAVAATAAAATAQELAVGSAAAAADVDEAAAVMRSILAALGGNEQQNDMA